MNSKKIAKIWLGAGSTLLVALTIALVKSPFLHSQGALAEFEHSRAVSAGVAGILGTLILTIGGWLFLKYWSK